MRRLLPLIFVFVSSSIWAQQPPKLEPLPEPPSVPPGVAVEAPGDAPVRIAPGQNDQIDEMVIEGKRVIRVTTPSGLIYYLRDDSPTNTGGGAIDRPLRVPLWVIHTF